MIAFHVYANDAEQLPLVLRRDPDLPPSPKPRYRSAYRYRGWEDLNKETLEAFSPFEIATRLFDYSALEPLLAADIYVASAKGQVPFHQVYADESSALDPAWTHIQLTSVGETW